MTDAICTAVHFDGSEAEREQFHFPSTAPTLRQGLSGDEAMADDRPGFRRPKSGKVIQVSLLGVELVEFTYHALQRMAARGVSEDDVFTALRKPSKSGLQTEPGKEHIQWRKDRRTLIDVVYAKAGDRIGIITVWRTRPNLIRPVGRKR
jgi:hypothetical protein